MGRMSRSVLKAEGPLDLGQGFVRGDDLGAVEVAGRDAGAQHVDAVELGLGGDGILVAGVADAVVGDLGGEVPGDVAAAQSPVGPYGDLVPARAPGCGPVCRPRRSWPGRPRW